MELENPGTYTVNVYDIHKDFRCMRKVNENSSKAVKENQAYRLG